MKKEKTIAVQCGLGNQLFQYAYMCYLQLNGWKVRYNLSYYDTKKVHDGFIADTIVDFSEFELDTRNLYSKSYLLVSKMLTNKPVLFT